jgi:hypothetical protein
VKSRILPGPPGSRPEPGRTLGTAFTADTLPLEHIARDDNVLGMTFTTDHAMLDKPAQPLWLCDLAALGFHCTDEPLVVFLV